MFLKYKLELDEKEGKSGRKTLESLISFDKNARLEYYQKKVEEEPENTEYHEELAKCYYSLNQVDKCIEEQRKNLEL